MLSAHPIPVKHANTLKLADVACPVELRRSPRAKRFSLKVSHTERAVILTLPQRGRVEDASAFLARHAGWLKKQMERLPEPVPFMDGSIIPLRGELHRLCFAGQMKYQGVVWAEQFESAYDFGEGALTSLPSCATSAWKTGAFLAPEHGFLPRLCVTGGEFHAPRRFADWLKAEVRRDLSERVRHHAQTLCCNPKRLSIRDQATRWGSCSTTGTLSFSWRLIFAPPFVLDYVAAHEVAHLREMNHGPRFWRLVRDAIPGMHKARAWLKAYGAELHRYGNIV
jgi:hypothetical protein